MVHLKRVVDRARQDLGAAQVDTDHARVGHGRHDNRFPLTEGPPEYTVYRSRPKLPWRRDAMPDLGGDDRRNGDGLPPRPPQRRPRVRRILAWLAVGVLAWCLVSLVLFLVSAQIQRQEVSDAAGQELSGGGFTFTSPNTILILGSDARTTDETAEPGSQGQPSRADTIMLLRIGGGHNATLSIPRDTVVDIPGAGQNKINAAYAIGGPALAVRTVEEYLGIEVNHLVEVDFANFPSLIDALGGIDVRTGCVISRINGGYRNGGVTLRLRPGVNHLDGDQALALARTRKNECRPSEDDRTRARRQQKILAAIKDRVTSVSTFVRLPWVSWTAPKAVRSDMAGPNLLGLVGASLTGGDGKTRVLKPSGTVVLPDGGAGLTVSEEEKQRAVQRFLAG
jgi:LCP family protein required for cell wall assembly